MIKSGMRIRIPNNDIEMDEIENTNSSSGTGLDLQGRRSSKPEYDDDFEGYHGTKNLVEEKNTNIDYKPINDKYIKNTNFDILKNFFYRFKIDIYKKFQNFSGYIAIDTEESAQVRNSYMPPKSLDKIVKYEGLSKKTVSEIKKLEKGLYLEMNKLYEEHNFDKARAAGKYLLEVMKVSGSIEYSTVHNKSLILPLAKLVQINYKLNNIDDVKLYIEKINSIEPYSFHLLTDDCILDIGIINFRLKKYEDAKIWLSKVGSHTELTNLSLTYFYKGRIALEKNKDFKKAIENFNLALDHADVESKGLVYSLLAKTYNTIGEISMSLSNEHEAKSAFEEALKNYDNAIKFNFSSELFLDKGIVLYHLSKYEKAIIHFNKAIELNKDNINALLCMGYSLLNLKKYKQAEVIFKKILSLDNKTLLSQCSEYIIKLEQNIDFAELLEKIKNDCSLMQSEFSVDEVCKLLNSKIHQAELLSKTDEVKLSEKSNQILSQINKLLSSEKQDNAKILLDVAQKNLESKTQESANTVITIEETQNESISHIPENIETTTLGIA